MALPAPENGHRLGEELQHHIASLRADRLSDADLARALRHARKQYVHDADAADEQGNSGERSHEDLEDENPLRGLLDSRPLIVDVQLLEVRIASRGPILGGCLELADSLDR